MSHQSRKESLAAETTLHLKTIIVGGVRVGVLDRRQWAENIVSWCQATRTPVHRPKLIFAANGQVVSLFATDPAFRDLFREADAVTADGQPLVWASRLTGLPLPERVATTDLFHDVAHAAERERLTFFLLGATERSNEQAAAAIRALYPALRIVGRCHGYFSGAEEAEIVEAIDALRPDVLWVGLGAMRQTEFAVNNADALSRVGCIVTSGGLFDYFTPDVRRAPTWMQKHALEWLFRAWQHPRKYLMRYLLTNPIAIFLLLTRTERAAASASGQVPLG